MYELEFLKEKHLVWIKENGDKALDWKEILNGFSGRVAEAGDGLVIGLFTKQINKWLTPKIPDNVKIELHQVFDGVIEGDHKKSLIELSDVVKVIIENKEIDEKFKPWIFSALEIYKGIIQQLMP